MFDLGVQLDLPYRLQVLEGLFLHAARPACVRAVQLIIELVATDHHLLGIDNNDEAAHVHAGRVSSYSLSPATFQPETGLAL